MCTVYRARSLVRLVERAREYCRSWRGNTAASARADNSPSAFTSTYVINSCNPDAYGDPAYDRYGSALMARDRLTPVLYARIFCAQYQPASACKSSCTRTVKYQPAMCTVRQRRPPSCGSCAQTLRSPRINRDLIKAEAGEEERSPPEMPRSELLAASPRFQRSCEGCAIWMRCIDPFDGMVTGSAESEVAKEKPTERKSEISNARPTSVDVKNTSPRLQASIWHMRREH